jgi:acetyl-CoA carboxylase biotin carboxyl carrier protein
MTDTDHALDEIARAAADLVPALTERLARHGLGEIEVTRGSLHLRVVAGAATPAAPSAALPVGEANQADATASTAPTAGAASVGVSSPAVGFFVYADGLGPGQSVSKGESLGHVEMLGVRHDVRAPRSGTVRHLVAETGEAVEYGQVVVELEATAVGR